MTEEKRLIQRLLAEVRKAESGLAAYGEVDVNRALDLGAVDTLLISEGLRRQRVTFRCTACAKEFTRTLPDEEIDPVLDAPCPNCGQRQMTEAANEDFVEGLFRRASDSGAIARLILRGERGGRDAHERVRRGSGRCSGTPFLPPSRYARVPRPARSGRHPRRPGGRFYHRLLSGSSSGAAGGGGLGPGARTGPPLVPGG